MAEAVGFAVFVDRLDQALGAVVHVFPTMAEGVEAPGRQDAHVALVARTVFDSVDDGAQAEQFVILQLVHTAFGIDDLANMAGFVVAVQGHIAHGVGRAGLKAIPGVP